jgi:hypothetical protein
MRAGFQSRISYRFKRTFRMKAALTGLAIATLLVAGSALPGLAQDAAQQPAAAQTPPPPPASTETVPRPSIVPKAAEPAAPAADNEPAPRHRHYAHHYRRYGYYRTAYWEPFPVYWPHLYHNRVHWNRIPWFVRF